MKLAIIAFPIFAFAEAFVGLGYFFWALLVIASSIVYENELLGFWHFFLGLFWSLAGDQAGFYIGKGRVHIFKNTICKEK
ncbi:MAG: hypothetical protein Ct9H90mP25_5830 [Gammaproteobacteria bacterium]|nr:MAG: hypothetical protein Ct9H90mP25_5830 [Gammaproteobacteria bacterium]